jgi:hypothetical protein
LFRNSYQNESCIKRDVLFRNSYENESCIKRDVLFRNSYENVINSLHHTVTEIFRKIEISLAAAIRPYKQVFLEAFPVPI